MHVLVIQKYINLTIIKLLMCAKSFPSFLSYIQLVLWNFFFQSLIPMGFFPLSCTIQIMIIIIIILLLILMFEPSSFFCSINFF